jgi:hypothetical protein
VSELKLDKPNYIWQGRGGLAFLDVAPEIDDLEANSRNKKVSDFLLRAIIACHEEQQPSLIC